MRGAKRGASKILQRLWNPAETEIHFIRYVWGGKEINKFDFWNKKFDNEFENKQDAFHWKPSQALSLPVSEAN